MNVEISGLQGCVAALTFIVLALMRAHPDPQALAAELSALDHVLHKHAQRMQHDAAFGDAMHDCVDALLHSGLPAQHQQSAAATTALLQSLRRAGRPPQPPSA